MRFGTAAPALVTEKGTNAPEGHIPLAKTPPPRKAKSVDTPIKAGAKKVASKALDATGPGTATC
jgi:hypothetical protein